MPAKDNYEVWRKDWQKRFLSMDHTGLLQKLPFLTRTSHGILFPYFNHTYLADTKTGLIHSTNHAPSMTLYDELNVYTLFWYTKEHARLKNNLMPFYQLQNAAPFSAAFQRGTLQPLAAMFDGKEDLLRKGLERLGGISLSNTHVCYDIHAFPCFPIRVLFWDGDEEFSAQANLLFDQSATDFNHVESVVTIASALIRRLSTESGVSLPGYAL